MVWNKYAGMGASRAERVPRPWSVIVIYNKGLYNRQRITEQVCILHDHCNSVKSEQALTGWCFPEWECAQPKGGGKFTIEGLSAVVVAEWRA